MSTFSSIAETRRLGAPVVRLVRLALGRDPDPGQLLSLAGRLKQGEALPALAATIAASDEFTVLHGPDGPPDDAFLARIGAQGEGWTASMGAPPPAAHDIAMGLRGAAALGSTRAELIAVLAESAWAREKISLLPGLAPGAPPDDPAAYAMWIAECEQAPAVAVDGAWPAILVVIGAGDGNAEAAVRTIESLRAQSHAGWQVHLAVRLFSAWPRDILARLPAADGRVRLVERERSSAWAADLDHAIASACQPLVCVLEAGDTLAPQALAAVAALFAREPEVQLVYTDEDVQGFGERRAPRFKPDFSPDTMLAGNAIGQLAVYRTALLHTIGGGQADSDLPYDLALRAARQAGGARIRHLPYVLCHRALAPSDWPAAADVPRKAPGVTVETPAAGRTWPRLRFALPALPPVSILMPTRDRAGLLAVAAAGVLEKTDYPAIELVVIDNGSTEPDALALLECLAGDARVRVLRRPGDFNFSVLCNQGEAACSGDILVLLNNDVEIVAGDWLTELVSHAVREEVGIAGARLLYPDGTLQHGGVLLGPAGAATHVGRHAKPDDPGYDGQLACVRDLSAVTGACLAIRRAVWRRVSGMDERLAVTWNDIDLCLRVRQAGLRVVWTPHAVLRHHEGQTRGLEAADAARQARFLAERDRVWEQFRDALERDPFLNPNLRATEAGPLVLTRSRLPAHA